MTHRPIMGFWLSLGVQMTHVTRRTTPKSTITEHTKNLIVAPKILSDPKIFQHQNFFQTHNFFWQKFFLPKICLNILFGHIVWPKFLWLKIICRPKFRFGPKFFSDLKFFLDQNFFASLTFLRDLILVFDFHKRLGIKPFQTEHSRLLWNS